MFNRKIHYKWSFSIAMLNYQRVHPRQTSELSMSSELCLSKRWSFHGSFGCIHDSISWTFHGSFCGNRRIDHGIPCFSSPSAKQSWKPRNWRRCPSQTEPWPGILNCFHTSSLFQRSGQYHRHFWGLTVSQAAHAWKNQVAPKIGLGSAWALHFVKRKKWMMCVLRLFCCRVWNAVVSVGVTFGYPETKAKVNTRKY